MRASTYLLLCLVPLAHVRAAEGVDGVPARARSNLVADGVREARDKQVDSVFKALNTPDTPGASVAVVENRKIVLEKGYGIANLEYEIPIKPETVFHVASVSKQFTAMAIVLLESDRKLSIDDDVHNP
jgi:CubicO group peptidase (beta-lactamase class C family)